ncbi:hypothetical protein CspHIS471_0205790 [Cutaneotrichosporon sp. HIS471]|nr:hypothetical protein CspHIS471_0205790 [Cutaneotrichosporon sp. HIS471]
MDVALLSTTDDELQLTDDEVPSKLRQGTVRALSPGPLSRPARGPPDLERVEHSGRQTGPKGVRDDARAAAAAARQRTADAIKLTRAEQERRAIVAPSFREEEARRALEALQMESEDEFEVLRRKRIAAFKRSTVREVDRTSYVGAVERRGWVLVAIYEPDMSRCDALLAALPTAGVPAVRARATRIGFSLLSDDTRVDYDSDDDEVRADPDVLPTLLVYRDGELKHNWVRVDLEPMYAAGLGALLESEGVTGLRDDDEEDEESD